MGTGHVLLALCERADAALPEDKPILDAAVTRASLNTSLSLVT